jgi:cytochrome c oxidase subunit IV
VDGGAPGSVAVLGNPRFALQLPVVAYGYAILVTLTAVLVEEFTFRRYHRWPDLLVIMVATAAENFGFRQLTAWWRVRGGWHAARRRRAEWGVMTRQGF